MKNNFDKNQALDKVCSEYPEVKSVLEKLADRREKGKVWIAHKEKLREQRELRVAKIEGLRYKKHMTLQAIGDLYGVSRERIRQILLGL